jgi:predicted Zn-dependent protease
MVSARSRVLSNSAVDALTNWALEVAPQRLSSLTVAQQAGALYGATLAALKLREFPAAQERWARLIVLVRTDPPAARLAALLGAELALAQGDALMARRILDAMAASKAADGGPSRAQLFLTSQAAIAVRQTAATTQALQSWLVDHPRDAQAWQLLASAYSAQGSTVAAIRAEAEVNVAQMDYPTALARLKAAQELAKKPAQSGSVDHFDASIVDTRTRQVELLLREQALER